MEAKMGHHVNLKEERHTGKLPKTQIQAREFGLAASRWFDGSTRPHIGSTTSPVTASQQQQKPEPYPGKITHNYNPSETAINDWSQHTLTKHTPDLSIHPTVSHNYVPPHLRLPNTINEQEVGVSITLQRQVSTSEVLSPPTNSNPLEYGGVVSKGKNSAQQPQPEPELQPPHKRNQSGGDPALLRTTIPVTSYGQYDSNQYNGNSFLDAKHQQDSFLHYVKNQAPNGRKYRAVAINTKSAIKIENDKQDQKSRSRISSDQNQWLGMNNHDEKRAVQLIDDGWNRVPPPAGKELVTTIPTELKEISTLPPATIKLSRDAILEKLAVDTREAGLSLDGRISDDGVQKTSKERVRWTQGEDAREELAEIDGSFMPAPCDWEDDRRTVDKSYIPQYIQEWQGSAGTCGLAHAVDMTADGFRLGTRPVYGFSLGEAVFQPDCFPDVQNSENERRRLHQTAMIDAVNFLKKWEIHEKRNAMLQRQADAYQKEIENREPEAEPFDPKIPCYFRPALQQDVSQITTLYNHYVKNNNITEDQKPIAEENVKDLLAYCKKEKLPIIIGVKGGDPKKVSDTTGRKTQTKIFIMPRDDVVIAFGFVEVWNYGLNGSRHGRSRNTANFQFYVHHEYTRKGVGRNLLDHMMHIMYRGVAWHNRTTFINPSNNPVYSQGGGGYWHQFVVQYPIFKKEDPNYEWFKKWLQDLFYFEEETRLKSVARSSVHQGKKAQWMDLIIFQVTAHAGMEFDCEEDA